MRESERGEGRESENEELKPARMHAHTHNDNACAHTSILC